MRVNLAKKPSKLFADCIRHEIFYKFVFISFITICNKNYQLALFVLIVTFNTVIDTIYCIRYFISRYVKYKFIVKLT